MGHLPGSRILLSVVKQWSDAPIERTISVQNVWRIVTTGTTMAKCMVHWRFSFVISIAFPLLFYSSASLLDNFPASSISVQIFPYVQQMYVLWYLILNVVDVKYHFSQHFQQTKNCLCVIMRSNSTLLAASFLSVRWLAISPEVSPAITTSSDENQRILVKVWWSSVIKLTIQILNWSELRCLQRNCGE